MSDTKLLPWPHSTCVECGQRIPAGTVRRCAKGGYCSWHVPAAVLARLTELTEKMGKIVDIGTRHLKGEFPMDIAYEHVDCIARSALFAEAVKQ